VWRGGRGRRALGMPLVLLRWNGDGKIGDHGRIAKRPAASLRVWCLVIAITGIDVLLLARVFAA
jgi:hypothetical protein